MALRLRDLPYWLAAQLDSLAYSLTDEAADRRRAYEAFVADGGDPAGIFEVEEWLGVAATTVRRNDEVEGGVKRWMG